VGHLQGSKPAPIQFAEPKRHQSLAGYAGLEKTRLAALERNVPALCQSDKVKNEAFCSLEEEYCLIAKLLYCLNNSTIQQFNNSTIQQFNSSTVQQFNHSTVVQQFLSAPPPSERATIQHK
jgi:hypothetical protein